MKLNLIAAAACCAMAAGGASDDTKPEYVIDGVSRPVNECVHGRVSDSGQELPQALTLTFPQPVTANEVRLTFDTDLTPARVAFYPKQLVKSYVVEGCVDGEWKMLAEEDRNDLRHRVHAFQTTRISALRVTVTERGAILPNVFSKFAFIDLSLMKSVC